MTEDYNYYDILEIKEDASPEIVKAAYRALAKKYHPDSYKGSGAERENKMSRINEAYETLSDSQKRRDYDLKLQSERERRNFTGEYKHDSQNYSQNQQGVNSEDPWEEKYESATSENQPEYGTYEQEEEKESGGRLARFFRGVGKEILRTMQENEREAENAYLEGLLADDYTLVRRFKQARGYKRVGYARALEEKGIFERDYDGKLIPAYRFREMFY